LLPLLLLGGCVADNNLWDDSPDGMSTTPGYGLVRMNFTTNVWPQAADTRTPAEGYDVALTDVHLILYDAAGQYVLADYFNSLLDKCQLVAPIANDYTLVAIANTADPDFVARRQGDLATLSGLRALTTADLAAWDDIAAAPALLMTGLAGGVDVVQNQVTRATLPIRRLAAKIQLDVTAAQAEEIRITDYTLYNLPRRTRLLLEALPTEALEADTATARAPGDAVTPLRAADWMTSDTLAPAAGATAFSRTFYMYENRPGIRPAIAAQQDKTPAKVLPDSCTYLVVRGSSPAYRFLEWTICLGANPTDNFNIKRSCLYTYHVTLTTSSTDTRVKMEKGEVSLGISPLVPGDEGRSKDTGYSFIGPAVKPGLNPDDEGRPKDAGYDFVSPDVKPGIAPAGEGRPKDADYHFVGPALKPGIAPAQEKVLPDVDYSFK
jgi:hypothetical protein